MCCLFYIKEWHDYPFESLPNSFQPHGLVELTMHSSCFQRLLGEFRNWDKLKHIDLSHSQNLIHTPDFIGVPNIQTLIFQGRTRLHVLHPSVGGVKQLTELNLKDCESLENLPHELNLESLEILILSGCSKLKKFPEIGRDMTSLSELYLDWTAIEELPPSIKHLTGLTLLNLQDCKNLLSFPSVICSLTSLEILTLSGCNGQQPIEALPCTSLRTPEPDPVNLLLPKSFSGLSTLVSLDLSDCNLLDGALPDLSYLCSLKFLKLSKNNFTYLPDSISELSKLKILFLDHCRQLKSFLYLPLSTQFVSARGCVSLENYTNRVVVWTSGEAGFTIIDFLSLTVDEGGKITELSFLDIQHQPLWQRFIEKQIEGIYGDFEVQSVPRLIDQSETNETKTQPGISDLLVLDFDRCQVYNSCFPLCEIPEWYNHQSDEPQLTIRLPPNVYNDSTWMGLALFASVAVEANQTTILDIQNSETSYSLVCHLETCIDCVEPLHVHHITKEDLKLLQQGGFIWLSYIPRDSFKESLNQCSRIEASVTINCPGLVQKCGFHLLYKHDEVEFKEAIRQYATVVSNEQEVSAKISSSSNEDPQSEPFEPADWKDKGKGVLEY